MRASFDFGRPTRCTFVTHFAVPLSPPVPQNMWTRQNRFCTFPSLIFLVPSLRRCDHVWPSFSSVRSEDETANVADDRLTRFDSALVRVAQDGLEGVVTRSFFGQFVCPFVASSHEAASLIQLGSLRFGQVCLAFRHFDPHTKPLSTVAQSETNVAPGSDSLPQCPQLCPQDASLHWERDRHGTTR